MHSVSLKKITLIGFSGPLVIILGAFISVALGRGQAIMLPSTVAALTFYGVLIAVGAAWRDGAPRLFRWTPNFDAPHPSWGYIRGIILLIAVLSVVAFAFAAMAWFAATLGVSDLLWRPLLTVVVCVLLGIGLASTIRPRVSA